MSVKPLARRRVRNTIIDDRLKDRKLMANYQASIGINKYWKMLQQFQNRVRVEIA